MTPWLGRSNQLTTAVAFACAAVACSEPSQPRYVGSDAGSDAGAATDVAGDVAEVSDFRVADSGDDVDARDWGSEVGRDADVVADVGSDARDMPPDLGPPCVPPPDEPQPFSALPTMLSDTGLFAEVSSRTFADGVRGFEPAHVLWSDGAVKTRWVWLPACAEIDTSDPDHWQLPVGAKFWKQFVVDGTLVETRLIHRFGPGPDDWLFGAYVWNDAEDDAVLTPLGQADARGTTHDVPNVQACEGCHGRLPERILGFGAIQLNHDGSGVVLADLVAERRLSDPLPSTLDIPGSDTDQETLGYLHANCGNCHNDSPLAVQLPNTPMSLRVSSHDVEVSDTGVSRTTIGVPVDRFSHPTCSVRIDPGSPSTSCLLLRMQLRGRIEQMPPIGTEIPHPEGVQMVSDWITALPP